MISNITKIILTLGAACLFSATGFAQNPECSYWSNRATQGWARSGLDAARGNPPAALYRQGRAARDTGRAAYFCSPEWDRNRGAVTRSPYWDRSNRYFSR